MNLAWSEKSAQHGTKTEVTVFFLDKLPLTSRLQNKHQTGFPHAEHLSRGCGSCSGSASTTEENHVLLLSSRVKVSLAQQLGQAMQITGVNPGIWGAMQHHGVYMCVLCSP